MTKNHRSHRSLHKTTPLPLDQTRASVPAPSLTVSNF